MNGMYPNNPLTVGQANFSPYVNQIPVNPVVPNYQPVQQPFNVNSVPRRQLDCVNGIESVYAFAMAPNSAVILVDNLQPKVWLVTTDSSGYKAVKGFWITPDEEDAPIPAEGNVQKEDPLKNLTERMDKLEERMNEYGQSNSKPSWQNKSGNGNAQPNDRNGSGSKGPNGNTGADVAK